MTTRYANMDYVSVRSVLESCWVAEERQCFFVAVTSRYHVSPAYTCDGFWSLKNYQYRTDHYFLHRVPEKSKPKYFSHIFLKLGQF